MASISEQALAEKARDKAAELSDIAQDTITAVREGAKTTKDRASSVLNDAAEAAEPMIEKVGEQAQRIGAKAKDYADEAYQRGKVAADQVGEWSRNAPLMSLVAAFGVGYVLSMLVHGRH
jgi:ElaB/YqjD/DUF883 family membrane-anchored ribosome-binding protein